MTGSTCIGLVTVLYNCERHLQLFFESIGKQTDRDYLVIVIDNNSEDASLEQARIFALTYNVPCEFIANESNLGIAVGNNQGIERARNLGIQHIVLINNDIGCESDLLTEIRSHAIAKKHRAWTCLAYYGDSHKHWYGGGRLSYWLARGIHFAKCKSERIKHPVSVTYAPTCLMYLHASVFEQIGLMDPQYFVYYDDTDFCYRLKEAGISLIYDPTVSFKHYVGGSSGGDLSAFFLRISTRNKFIYIHKHYSMPMRWVIGFLALASKLAQLANGHRRHPTWQGIVEAVLFLRGVPKAK